MGWPALAIYGGYLAGKYIYHRLTYEPPIPPKPEDLKVPTTAQGTPVPLLYGRCLVRQAVLAWAGNADFSQRGGFPDGTYQYDVDMLFVAGIPFRNGTTRLWSIQLDGRPLTATGLGVAGFAPNFGGSATTQADNAATVGVDGPAYFDARFEFGDGATTQDFTTSDADTFMQTAGVPSTLIPGFRNFVTLLLDSFTYQPRIPAIGVEVSTYLPGFSPTARIGEDCNPVVVIEDLLTGGFGKLGLSTTLIDADSFADAAEALADEEMGYSRCIDERREASDIINEILEQIDAVLYEDFRDGLEGSIRIKLIRPDYTVSETPHITPRNCEAIENFAITSMSDAVNLVRVVYTDRANNYAEGEAVAMDGAIITASGEGPVEAVLHYPGCCTSDQAELIATRELAARGQPIARCTAIVDSTFKDVNPGDAIRLSWPEYHLNERMFRVGQVDRGTFTDGRIRLDLVQDFFYVHRRTVEVGGPVTSFPSTGPLELDPG